MRVELENTAKYKSKKFAVRIVNLYKYLCNEKNEFILSKQILRSGTSIGANIAEAECGSSKKDFLNKIYIALKECVETIYWLDLLFETEYLKETEYNSIKNDCEELRKMLSSTTRTITSVKSGECRVEHNNKKLNSQLSKLQTKNNSSLSKLNEGGTTE